ncbi:MAG: protein kinase, partial [Candidatus Eremiobacteraeota bacterium]|nr:protein kinase [Candidatus Eremiobacteraeota bacterium]
MALTDRFVLPAGSVLQPVSELPEKVRREIGSQDGDFVLSWPQSRSRARVIDADAAELVREFQQPATIAQAVARFSKGKAVVPERILDDALPMLQSLLDAGFLVAPDSDEARQIRPTLETGEEVNGWSILRCVQTMHDTEVYQTRGPLSDFGALKIARSNLGSVRLAIEREAAILGDLDGSVTPRLLASGDWASRPYVLMEWLQGGDAQLACAELRHRNDLDARRSLHRLTGSVLKAYAHLHEQGIVHGDVHARNILIERNDTVRILDLGLAEPISKTARNGASLRGGVGFFLEPEFARAQQENVPLPPVTSVAEQYSLAALLYLLITGAHYLDFSLEKTEMLRQIAGESMLPFAHRGLGAWPDLERLLAKALSKDPKDRFSSVSEFAACWRDARVPQSSARAASRDDE